MIKIVSNIKPYELPWSGDSAFVQLPEDATEDQRKEHAHKWTVARETGDLSALRLPGSEEPTYFTLRQLSSDALTFITGLEEGGSPGVENIVLAFRYALVSVRNFSEQVTYEHHPRLGQIASMAFFDKAGAPATMSVAIAVELGASVLARARHKRPS